MDARSEAPLIIARIDEPPVQGWDELLLVGGLCRKVELAR